MALLRSFTEHPASVGETYGEHCRVASGVGVRLLGAGLACLVHGLLPWLFATTASRTVSDLHARFRNRGAGGIVTPRRTA